MKKRNLLWGSIGVAAAATAVVVSPMFNQGTPEATYSPKQESALVAQGAKGHKEFYDYWHTNHETGELMDEEDFARQRQELAEIRQNRSTVLSWSEEGPANIGGRTRAICIDVNDRYHLLAGSVTGGLWESKDAANTWSKVEAYDGSFHISTIAQTINGNYYVGTGMSYGGFEGYDGDGIHTSTDGGVTWTPMAGTSGMSRVQEIATDGVSNTVWIADYVDGLYKSDNGAAPQLISGTNGLDAGGIGALSVSNDGQVIVVGIAGFGRETFVSRDGGQTFTNYSAAESNTSNPIAYQNKNRVEYSISADRVDGEYYIYAVFSNTSSHFGGAWVSQNSGQDWFEVAPNVTTTQVNNNDPEVFNPVASGSNPQGAYNLVVAATPWNETGFFVGGIDVYRWQRQVDSPPFGDFKQVSQWFADPTSSSYIHADNHEIKFDIYNRMYIGNDGGIGVCDLVWPFFESGFGLEFYPANRNYNVTQFYDVSFSGHGDIIGGTQDNGTLYNDHTNHTYQDFVEVLGGDGFAADISSFNRYAMFGSSQYNNIFRSNDGSTWNPFVPTLPSGTYGSVGSQGGLHPFNTKLRLGEVYDENSLDSVTYIPTRSYTSGEAMRIPSLSSGDSMDITAPYDLLYEDTVFYDPTEDVVEYIVRDSVTGVNLIDLGITNHSTTPFPSSSNLNPPVIGDSILITNEGGISDTVVVAEVTPYNYHYGKNPVDGRLIPMHMNEEVYGVSWDTLRVQDPFQSWFFMYTFNNNGEIWATRDALRFAEAEPRWGKIIDNIGTLNQITFSKDADRVYLSTSTGLKVIDGIGDIYTQESDFLTQFDLDSGATATTITTILSGNVGSCAVDYTNEDHIVTAPVGGGAIRESNNATSGSPTFTTLAGLTSVVYDVEIVQDVAVGGSGATYILAGTDEGVMLRNGTTWEDCSEGFGKTPVYSVKYAWRTWDEGNHFYGAIYLGTHGRGAWKSSTFVGMPDNADYPTFEEGFKTDLTVFPNPVEDQASLGFVLAADEDVKVEVYNLSGKLVKSLPKKHMLSGQNQMVLDVADLNAGTYVVKMIAGNKQDVTKFVKSK